MQNTTPEIPLRTSSRAAIYEHQLRLQKSRAELKRKLSGLSCEDAPIPYRRLKIEEIELQREELKVHKTWLDVEHGQKFLSDSDLKKEHRETNKRIISLGSELWAEQEALRAQEEKTGRISKLGPDSRGAFVHTLLALYKDPRQSRKRSSKVQSQMKKSSIIVYEAGKGAPSKDKIWCCITQDYYDKHNVIAAHIVPHSLGPELVDYIFGAGSGSRLDSADNCILMYRSVEKAFDNGSFVLMPVDAKETPIRRWKVQVTNLAALDADLAKVHLKDLDGKELVFKNDNRPASRFLYYHFVVTLLRNKRDRQQGWERYLVELPTGRPFATIGRNLRESMLLALAKMAGDLDPLEEARLLGGEGETFVEAEKLSEVEEEEVARRALEAHEVEDEDEDDNESSEDDD